MTETTSWPHATGEMADRIRAFDWSQTSLGALAAWPERLRLMVELVLANPQVSSLVCGPERRLIYNDAAARFYGKRHPAALGQPLPEAFPEGWSTVAPLYERAFAGKTVEVGSQPLDTRGDGKVADVFEATLMPVRDDQGHVAFVHMVGREIGSQLRAGNAARESEALLRMAMSGGRMGTWRWDLANQLVWGDAQFLEFWGFPPSDEAHPLSLFTERMSVEGAAEMQAIVTKAVEAKEEFDGPLEIVAGPPSGRWIRWRGRADAHDPSILFGVTFDITEQRRAEQALRESEERQAFLLQLSDALRPIEDPLDIQRAATRMLGEHLGASRVFYVIVDPDGDTATILADYTDGVPSRVGRYSLAAFSSHAVADWRAGWVANSSDVTIDQRYSEAERAAYASVSTRAGFGIPLSKNGRLVALLGVNQSTPRRWTDYDIDLASEIADRTWAAVEHARAEEARRLAEDRALAASEAARVRITATLESIGDAFYAVDADFRLTYVNAKAKAMWGRSSETLVGRNLWSEFPGAVGSGHHTQHLAVMRDRHPAQFEGRSPVLGRWMDASVYPDPVSGGLVCYFRDTTERHTAEAALREAEEQQRLMLELVPALLWWADPAGDRITGIHRWQNYTGQSESDAQDLGWLDAIHPDDLPATKAAFEHAFATGEPLERQQRIRRNGHGYRWHFVRHVPVRDADGTITRWFGAAVDVDEIHRMQDEQSVLIAELHHRTRNLIGVIGMIMRQVLASSTSLADFRTRFTERLEALSRVQSLFSRRSDEPIAIGDIVRIELDALGADLSSERVRIEGEAVTLRKATVQTLALAIHELATNARKYGALHGDSGVLAIRWEEYRMAGGARRLRFTWTETGIDREVEETQGPLHRGGYGRRLIEEALPYTLKATTTYTLGTDRLDCTVDMPLDR